MNSLAPSNKISIITPCYNEVDNLPILYAKILESISGEKNYLFEFIFIDNCSSDGSQEFLKNLSIVDRRVKVILNNRNFGHIRSPYWGILQCYGDAVIYMASDLQDPPELISEFLREWENGYKVVLGVKPTTCEHRFSHFIRTKYYQILRFVAEAPIVENSTGFGLYDKKVIELLREVNDPYPFLRGLISDFGFRTKTVVFNQPRRARGLSKNNFYTLYDIGILGLISHSMLPIRIATFLGLATGLLCIFLSFAALFAKIIFWDSFPIGYAPVAIIALGLFGLLFLFIGLLGEYIGSIHTYVKKRPIVVESQRINFE